MDTLIDKFKELLSTSNSENEIQTFLEDNSELIPLPFLAGHQLHESVVISKLPIGNEYITDFAYLTKCSDYWNLVLIEIEKPTKKLFLKDNENINFSADFNKSYDQVTAWKSYLEEDNHKNELKKKVAKLMGNGAISRIPFDVKYVFIIGRSADKEGQDRRIRLFNQKNTDDIKVKTFDSLISEYNAKPSIPKIIVTPWKEQGFCIKKVPTLSVETHILGYLNSEYIKINPDARCELIKQGYCIEHWENGELLTEYGKYDKLTYYHSLSDGLVKSLFESELQEAGKL